MVADDNPELVEVVCAMLEAKGYNVMYAEAKLLFKRPFEISEKTFGPKAPDVEETSLLEDKTLVENGIIEPKEENKQELLLFAAYCLTAAMLGANGKIDQGAIDVATAFGQRLIEDFDSELFREVCNNPDRLPDVNKLSEAMCEDLEEEQRELVIELLRVISALYSDRSSEWKAFINRVSIGLNVTAFDTYPHGGPYHHATGIVFPDKIAGLENLVVNDFEAKNSGLGIGLRYSKGDIKADIYLYNCDLAHISDGINSTLITQHFKLLVGDMFSSEKKGHYHSVNKLSEGEISLGNQPALSASFSYFQADIERVSNIYLTGFDKHFLKIRFTYFKSEETSGKASLSKLLAEIGKLLVNAKD